MLQNNVSASVLVAAANCYAQLEAQHVLRSNLIVDTQYNMTFLWLNVLRLILIGVAFHQFLVFRYNCRICHIYRNCLYYITSREQCEPIRFCHFPSVFLWPHRLVSVGHLLRSCISLSTKVPVSCCSLQGCPLHKTFTGTAAF